ncbi:hypothetical protein Syun_003334 [Stephania yunnanensis]|uniref:Uncharacterized protein n=1 Tax=Stephania yunnanensis TaxID=152371 RepID=A0AAP0L0X9_9MAGN
MSLQKKKSSRVVHDTKLLTFNKFNAINFVIKLKYTIQLQLVQLILIQNIVFSVPHVLDTTSQLLTTINFSLLEALRPHPHQPG